MTLGPATTQPLALTNATYSSSPNVDLTRAILGRPENRRTSPFSKHLQRALILDQRWSLVGRHFDDCSFVDSENGEFIMAGPLKVRREGKETVEYGGIAGVVDLPLVNEINEIRRAAKEYYACRGYVRLSIGEKPSTILPFRETWSTGPLSGESGEAFIVPDAWNFPHRSGPALLNLTEQRRRFSEGGEDCIRRIFDNASADLLIGAVSGVQGDRVRAIEYALHSLCHSSGYGFRAKIRLGWFSDPSSGVVDRAYEELRASSTEYWLLSQVFCRPGPLHWYWRNNKPYELQVHPGALLASACCTMFGMDIHRGGGFGDIDVRATVLILDKLLNEDQSHGKQGQLIFDQGLGRFRFTVPTYNGIVEAFQGIGDFGFGETCDEARYLYEKPMSGLLGVRAQSRAIEPRGETLRLMAEHMIAPCRGIYGHLR